MKTMEEVEEALEERCNLLEAKVAELDKRLSDHINVPSWWNKQTDQRLAELERTSPGGLFA